MNDFDFDELDRAVSSVLSKTTPGEPAASSATVSRPLSGISSVSEDKANDAAPAIPVPVRGTSEGSNDQTDDSGTSPTDIPSDDTVEQSSTLPASTESQGPSLSSEESGRIDLTPLALDDVPTPAAVQSMPDEEPVIADPAPDEQFQEPGNTQDSTFEQPKTEEVETPVARESTPAEGEDTTLARESDSEPDTPPTSPVTRELPQLPTRRGRFMDVVSSGVTPADQPLAPATPTRTTMKFQPSADFVRNVSQSTPPASADTDQSMSRDDSVMPDTPSSPVQLPAEDVSGSDTALEHVEGYGALEPVAESDDVANHAKGPDHEDDNSPGIGVAPEVVSTPFIPDVEVDKRPLNTLSSDPTASEQSETSDKPGSSSTETSSVTEPAVVDAPAAVVTTSVPKEFNAEIMAVEANESVGSVPAAETSAAHTSSPSQAPVSSAADMTHPMFDTSSLSPQTAHTSAHSSSKITWVVIGTALFLVGAVLGVLYFLYGQS